MSKFVSIMTNTYSSDISYDEWLKRTNSFFFDDERIVQVLRQNGMIKWTIYKTEDVEPVKVIAVCEYKSAESFKKCQDIFLKFLPKIQDMIIKTNFARASVVKDAI